MISGIRKKGVEFISLNDSNDTTSVQGYGFEERSHNNIFRYNFDGN